MFRAKHHKHALLRVIWVEGQRVYLEAIPKGEAKENEKKSKIKLDTPAERA